MPRSRMPARVSLSFALATSVGCGPPKAAPRDEAPAAVSASEPEAHPFDSYALVSARERVRQRPDETGSSIALDTRRDHVDGWHYPVAVRVIGEAGKYVEVETIAPPLGPLFCAALHDLSLLSVRGFVPRDALLPVTRVSQTLRFEDGTSLSLARGVAVHPDADLVEVGGVQLGASIPAADVSSSHADPGPFARPGLHDYRLLPDARATYGPYTLAPSAFALHRDPKGLMVTGVESVEGDERLRLATIHANCVSFRVRTRAADLVSSERPYSRLDGSALAPAQPTQPVQSGWESFRSVAPGRTLQDMWGVGEYDLGGDVKTRYRVSAGAPVYWPDGARAGSVGDMQCLFHWPPTDRDGHACFELHGGDPSSGVVCFDADDTRKEPIDVEEPADGAAADTDHGW